MHFPTALVDQGELRRNVEGMLQELHPDVQSLDYNLGEDWSGDAGMFFRVVISDVAARPDVFHKVARRVRDLVEKKMDPFGKWGIIPYFSFRTESDNNKLNNEGWG